MMIGLFTALILLVFTADRRRIIARCALVAIMPLVVIAPITIRNYALYGEFVPIQVGVGLNLWEGIGESSDGRFGAVAKDEQVAEQEAVIYGNPDYAGWWASPDGIKRDRDRVSKSLAIIKENPGWYSGVMLKRMSDMMKYSAHAPLVYQTREPPPETAQPELAPGRFFSFARSAARFLQRIAKETLLPMIAIGFVAILAANWRTALFILITPLYYLFVQSIMHTEFRYVLSMHYFVFIFAAVGWALLAAGTVEISRRLVRRVQSGS
jgi:hypothetical protein